MSTDRTSSLRRAVRRFVALLVFLLVVEYLVIPQLAGARRSLSTLANVNLSLLAAAVLAEVGAVLSYAQLQRSVLPKGSAPSLLRTTQIQLATLAVSHLVPGGAAAGSGLGIKLLADEGVSGEDAGFGITVQSLGSAVVLNVMLWVALVASIPLHGYNPLYATASIVGVILLGTFFALVVGLTRGEKRAAAFLRAVARKTPFLDEERVHGAVHRVASRLRAMLADRSVLLRAIGWAAANWLFDAGCLWIFLAAFGTVVDPVSLLVAYGLANVLAAIPITPGGLVGIADRVRGAARRRARRRDRVPTGGVLGAHPGRGARLRHPARGVRRPGENEARGREGPRVPRGRRAGGSEGVGRSARRRRAGRDPVAMIAQPAARTLPSQLA
jgi:uncharacterized protein (TIRG00374 family)